MANNLASYGQVGYISTSKVCATGEIAMQINILEAKNQLSQLIKQAQAGDEVIIANRGTPVVRLVPTGALLQSGGTRNFLQWLDENPLPAYAQHSAQEIDAGIAEERSAWD